MPRRRSEPLPDLYSDPFAEHAPADRYCERMWILGCEFRFESNSAELIRLVRDAYAKLPRPRRAAREGRVATHAAVPELSVRLLLTEPVGGGSRSEPPPFTMVRGRGLLGGATAPSSFVMLSPLQRSALVVVSPGMLRFPYHTRYELIEFAVFTLAARVRQLVPLHAACVGYNSRGVLLMGESGSGKSTISLLSVLAGLEFLSEDSVFVEPRSLMASGVSNFLHVRSSSLRWVSQARERAAIVDSPVIRRRSGVRKFELDLRRRRYRVAHGPVRIEALVFLSAAAATSGSLLRPVGRTETIRRLTAAQAYAAGQPGWDTFCAALARVGTFVLERGRHPRESVEALRQLTARRG